MIVLIPYGHTVEPGTSGWPFVRERGDFVAEFISELLPLVESLYRISAEPKDRALAGFSMGGYHTLKIGLNNPDKFGNLGVFSWGAGEKWLQDHAPAVLSNPAEIDEVSINSGSLSCR